MTPARRPLSTVRAAVATYPAELGRVAGRTRTVLMDSLGVDLSFLNSNNAGDSDEAAAFEVGERVRVIASNLVLYHVPKHPELNPKGLDGTVAKLFGNDISANLPIVVAFEEPRKFTAHFLASELERV
eukprot:CAMPEP_0119415530 /NCGR_PEP_ID=MMETSP1335-20130426/9523_1 /TAXON_ID=259385 /ORGANISM="Chrysoculter rhomboideus, Strain RCC1486" /LENGTH=127 /DNA_ID=CAMNT_0007440535 /DNA_START=9 /DNA_END=392 /DNA_ORIENTATION=+